MLILRGSTRSITTTRGRLKSQRLRGEILRRSRARNVLSSRGNPRNSKSGDSKPGTNLGEHSTTREKPSARQVTDYFYLGAEVIAEKQGSSWTDYVFFAGKRTVKQTGSTFSTATFIHTDHLNSTRSCSDSSGNSTGTCDYDPFGQVQPGASCSLPVNYRFAGMEWDSETGLYRTSFRYYDVLQGRWMSVDPLPGDPGDLQSTNRYAYVLNDPANLIDPLGLFISCPPGCQPVFGGGDPRLATGCSCIGQDGPGGPGSDGGCNPNLRVSPGARPGQCTDTATDKMSIIEQTRRNVLNALLNDPDCLSFLGSAKLPVISTLKGLPITQSSELSYDAWTRTETPVTQNTPIHAETFVNPNGRFFKPGDPIVLPTGQVLEPGKASFQGFALLHELGHATGILPQDFNSDQQELNNINLGDKCRKALKQLGIF